MANEFNMISRPQKTRSRFFSVIGSVLEEITVIGETVQTRRIKQTSGIRKTQTITDSKGNRSSITKYERRGYARPY